MNTISINELYKIQEKKEIDKIKIYKLILSKFYEKIIYLSKMGRIELFYQLPDILYGLPLYDKNACICYIIYNLRKKGFFVKYIHPNGIHINWNKEKKSNKMHYLT